MTTWCKALVVTFKDDRSEEYAKAVAAAILLFDGVADARPVEAHLLDDEVARARVADRVRDQMLAIYRDLTKGTGRG
jgi:hypothetical protein